MYIFPKNRDVEISFGHVRKTGMRVEVWLICIYYKKIVLAKG